MKEGEHAETRDQRLISLEYLLEDVSSVSPGTVYSSTLMQTLPHTESLRPIISVP